MKTDYMIGRFHIMVFAVVVLFLPCKLHAASGATVDYHRQDSLTVIRLLQSTPHHADMGRQVLAFAKHFLGLPYVGKTLDGNAEERLVVNLRQLDCTTFVETVLALARTAQERRPTFAAYCDNLRRLRYRNGQVKYTNRLHYFTLWMLENRRWGAVSVVEGPNPPFTLVQDGKPNFMSAHPALYPMLKNHPEWMDDIRQMEAETAACHWRYIPQRELANTRLINETVKDGDIIVVVTNKQGLDTSHVGLAIHRSDGVHLLHASSTRKRVIIDPRTLRDYITAHRSQIGIMVVRPL